AAARDHVGRAPVLAVVFDLDAEILRRPGERQHFLLGRHPTARDERNISAAALDGLLIAFEKLAALAAFSDSEADRVEFGNLANRPLDNVPRVVIGRGFVGL